MKEQIYTYQLHFFRKESWVTLSQEQGEKLSIVLMSENPSRFVMINNNIYQTSSISRLVRKKEYSFQKDERDIGEDRPVIRELSPSERVVKEKYNQLVKKLSGSSPKLLNKPKP